MIYRWSSCKLSSWTTSFKRYTIVYMGINQMGMTSFTHIRRFTCNSLTGYTGKFWNYGNCWKCTKSHFLVHKHQDTKAYVVITASMSIYVPKLPVVIFKDFSTRRPIDWLIDRMTNWPIDLWWIWRHIHFQLNYSHSQCWHLIFWVYTKV